jgi:hypothetical protein
VRCDFRASATFGGAADTYFAFMTEVSRSSGIPTPPLIISDAETSPRLAGHPVHFGAVMKDHSQGDNTAHPYSPLMCILLLLATGIVVKIGAGVHLPLN